MTLKEQTIKGVRWSVSANGIQQGLQIIITVVLARLLMPEDFGVLAMAVVFSGLIAVFNDFGIGAAIIQKQDITDDDLSSIFWFNAFVGLIATLLTIAIAPLIAAFYQKDILLPLLSLMALGFLFTGLSTVQQSLLMKEMNFKKVAIFEIISTLIGGIVAVFLAYRDYGVWSLAWQGLSATIITAFLFWITSQWRPKFKFNFNSIKSIMGFSLNLLGFNFVNYLSKNVGYLLIGKFLGTEPLGYYTLAYRLMLYPIQNISHVVSRVLFPAFSNIQKNNELFRDAYLKSTRYIAFVTFPMMFGIFTVADEFILTFFGPKWEPTIFLFKVLCFTGMLQSIIATVGKIYLAKGKTDWMFRWSILKTAVFISAFSIGLLWDLKGVVIAYTVSIVIIAYPNFVIPFRLIGLKVKTLMQNLKTEFSTSLIMFGVVSLSASIQRHLFIDSKIVLTSNVLLGVIIYIIATKKMNNRAFNEIQEILWKKG